MKKLSLCLLAGLLLANVAWAQHGPGSGMNRKIGKIVKELKLTEQQQKDFQKIKTDMMKSMIEQGSKLATARIDLQQMFNADNPDKSAIDKKVDEMGDQVAQLGKMMVANWFAVNKMLNADQQKVWKKALNIGPMMQGMMREKGEKDEEEDDDEDGK